MATRRTAGVWPRSHSSNNCARDWRTTKQWPSAKGPTKDVYDV